MHLRPVTLVAGLAAVCLRRATGQNTFFQCDPGVTGSSCGVCPVNFPSQVLYDLSALTHDTVISVETRQKFAYAPCGFAGSDLLINNFGSYDTSRCMNGAVQPSGCYCHDDGDPWCGVMASDLGARYASGLAPSPAPQYQIKYDFFTNPLNANEQVLRIRYTGLPACVSVCSGSCAVTVLLHCDASVQRSAKSPNASMAMVQAQSPLGAFCQQKTCDPCYDLTTPAMCKYQPNQGCANNCSNNGVCNENGSCVCFTGWRGTLCNQPAGCQALLCSNDAGCAALSNSTYVCVCNAGFSGNGTVCVPNPVASYSKSPDAFPPAASITLVVLGGLLVSAGLAWVFIIYCRRTHGYHAVGVTAPPTDHALDGEASAAATSAASTGRQRTATSPHRRSDAHASATDVELTSAAVAVERSKGTVV